MTDRLTLRAPAILLALLVLGLLIPSANFLVFSGLPLDSLPEYALLILLIPLLLSQRARRYYRTALLSRGPRLMAIMVVGTALVVGSKAILLASGTHQGFLACYITLVGEPPAGLCEKAFENPFSRYGMTRIDRQIDFDGDEWGLSFINSIRFNFYAWQEGAILRERLPFEVVWTGISNVPLDANEIKIEYVGEGIIDLGGEEPIQLPASYDTVGVVVAELAGEPQRIDITYRFDDGYRVGQSEPPGPTALIRVTTYSGSVSRDTPLVLQPGGIWLGVGYLIDLVIILLSVAILAIYARALRREWWLIVTTGVLGLAILGMPEFDWLPRTRALLPLFWLLFISLVFRPNFRRLTVSYFSLAYLAVIRASLFQENLNAALVRGGGSDFLTHESFARTILETGSLEAGEAIFYYQPLFRYWVFVERILIGDGDGLIAAIAILASAFGIFLLFFRLDLLTGLARWRIVVPALSGLFLLTLINTWDIVYFFHAGASEFPTWIIFPYLVVYLFLSKDRVSWLLGIVLISASFLLRTNQAVSLIVIVGAFFIGLSRQERRNAWYLAAVLLLLAFTPAIHNLIYGGEFVILPTSAERPENLVLPPTVLFREFGDPGVRAEAVRQIERLLYFGDLAEQASGISLALHGLQIVFMIAWIRVISSWKSYSVAAKALIAVPVLHLLVQFFFVLDADYPRHILIAHFAMGVAAMYVYSAHARLSLNESVPKHQMAASSASA